MQQRTCLITGATNGVGRAAAVELVRRGQRVLVHGRDAARVQALADELGDAAVPLVADLSSLAAVRQLADAVLAAAPKLDVLVLNAAIWPDHREESEDGYELTLQVNYLSHYLLTRLLTERLIESAPARVIVTSPVAHQGGRINFDDLHMRRAFRGDQAYANSKLAQVLFCASLASRLRGRGVTVNSLCPGLVRSGLIANNRDFDHARVQLEARMQPAEYGAALTVHLACAPELAETTGCFFSRSWAGSRPLPIDAPKELSEALWQVSEELTA